MEISQIISYIKDNVKHTQVAFIEKDLDYNPEIIISATLKELRKMDESVDINQFEEAIHQMHTDGLVHNQINGIVYFNEEVLA